MASDRLNYPIKLTAEANLKQLIGSNIVAGNDAVVKNLFMTSFNEKSYQEIFTLAVRYGDVKIVKHAVSVGYDIHTLPDSILTLTLGDRNMDMTMYLLDQGFDPKRGDNHALKFAVIRGDLNFIKILISKGCNPLELGKYDLQNCISSGHFHVVDFLTKKFGVDFNNAVDYTLIVNLIHGYKHHKVIKYAVKLLPPYERQVGLFWFSIFEQAENIVSEYIFSQLTHYEQMQFTKDSTLRNKLIDKYNFLTNNDLRSSCLILKMKIPNIVHKIVGSKITCKRNRLRENLLKQILRPKSMCIQFTYF
jgi:hypothetical protein